MISDKIELASREALEEIKKVRKNFTYYKINSITGNSGVKEKIDKIVADVAKKHGIKPWVLKRILT